MRASKVSRETLEAAAEEVGVRAEIDRRGSGWKVKLFPLVTDDMRTASGRRRVVDGQSVRAKYQRRSASGFRPDRMVHAICWHGFRDFFRAVYRREPAAVFRTAFAVYRGSDNFESAFPDTAARNIGSRMYPVAADEACFCGARERLRNATIRVMRQSDLLRCPHCILVPDHYRPDGSCYCNDQNHVEMSEWGYTWNGSAWA